MHATSTAIDERRRSKRAPHVAEAWVHSPTARDRSEGFEVQAINLSRHGVAFNAPKAMPTGAFYMIHINLGEQKLSSEVRIIACRDTGTGTFEIGAAFC